MLKDALDRDGEQSAAIACQRGILKVYVHRRYYFILVHDTCIMRKQINLSSRLTPVEHARNHGTTKIPRQRARVESALKNAARLAELIASRESQSIRDGEDKSNDCIENTC